MIPRSFGTHNGSFHADEVTACALLLAFDLIDQEKIVRTRDPEKLEDCEFVCDVGGLYDPNRKRFDHHQLDYTGEFSSAGMTWRYLLDQGEIDQRLYDFIYQAVIIGVDAHDNGKVMQQEGVCTLSHVVANFVPIHHTAGPQEQDRGFFEALGFVRGHFQRLINRYHYIGECSEKVGLAMATKKEFLLFDEAMPWQESFFELGGEKHPALFIVMPSGEHWKLRGIPPNPRDKMAVRLPLPEKWAGLRDVELREITGIDGAIFCHKGRFISIWETKEDALKALDLVLIKE